MSPPQYLYVHYCCITHHIKQSLMDAESVSKMMEMESTLTYTRK